MFYIIIALIVIGIICKITVKILETLVDCQKKRKKMANSDDLLIINEEKDTKPGEMIVNLSLAPGAVRKIKEQVENDVRNFSGNKIEKETSIIEKAKEYPLRKKQYISTDEFRFQGEEDYIIRLEQSPPPGFNNKIFEKVMIEKISYISREEAINSFIYGNNRSLLLERSSSKKYGIKIIGKWQSVRKIRQAQLGWVPFFQSAEIYTSYPQDTPLAATIRKIFKPRPGKNPGLRYDIWIP